MNQASGWRSLAVNCDPANAVDWAGGGGWFERPRFGWYRPTVPKEGQRRKPHPAYRLRRRACILVTLARSGERRRVVGD